MTRTKARRKATKPRAKMPRGRRPAAGVVLRKGSDYCELVAFELSRQGLNYQDIQELTEKAGSRVHYRTAENHALGMVVSPQIRTVVAILNALGYSVRMKQEG